MAMSPVLLRPRRKVPAFVDPLAPSGVTLTTAPRAPGGVTLTTAPAAPADITLATAPGSPEDATVATAPLPPSGVTLTPQPTFLVSPDTLPGLQLWLDADDAATVTLNGGTVSQWLDKSANGYALTQGTAANQPAYTTGGLNGRNVLTFDGVNDVLKNAAAHPAPGSTSRTAFLVYASSVAPSSIRYALYLGSFASTAASGTVWAASQENAVRVNGGYNVFSDSNYPGPAVAALVQNGTTTGDISHFFNGSPSASTSLLSRSLDTGAGIAVGGHGYDAFSQNLAGYIAEIILYDSALSETDRQAVEAYLLSKWGLA